MLMFWIICSLLILFTLWYLLPSLFVRDDQNENAAAHEANLLVYQDQFRELEADLKNGLIAESQYQQDKEELERRLLADMARQEKSASPAPSAGTKNFGYGVAAFIPIAAISFYFFVGNRQAFNPTPASGPPPNQPGQMSQQQIAANVEKLAQRLQQNPNDLQGWTMLGNSYMNMERFSDAAAAFEHATSLNDKDAGLWSDYAEALALANGQNLAGKPTDAINRALQVDPKNQKALDLAGSAAYQIGDYKKAIDYWKKLLDTLPPGSPELKTITEQISKAQQLATGKGSR